MSISKRLTGFQKFYYLIGKEAKNYWHVHILTEIDLTEILEKTEGKIKITSIFLKAIDYTIRKNWKEFPELNAEFLAFPYKRIRYFDFIGANVPILKKINDELIIDTEIINDIHKKSLQELDSEIEDRKKSLPKYSFLVYRMPLFLMRVPLFLSKYFDKFREQYRGTFVLIKVGEESSEVYVNPNCTLQFVIHAVRDNEIKGDNRICVRKICKLSINADHRLLHGGIMKQFISDLKYVLEKDYQGLLG